MTRILCAALLLLLIGPAARALAADSCPAGARCGRVTVPLDHTGRTPGTLPLAYATLPATGPRTGTVVLLSGGPGEAAISLVPDLKGLLAPLRDWNDVVFVDQRGTGRSADTSCSGGLGDTETAVVAACARALGPKLSLLTTGETAEDLENLRLALGADRLTLLGVSYGTLVAQEYARRHPDHTAAVVLDSPVGPGGFDGTGAGELQGLGRVLAEECAGGPCAAGVPDMAGALAAAGNRLRRGALRVPVVRPSGRIVHARVTQQALLDLIETSDELPSLRAELPPAIASLAAGDGAPFAHISGSVARAARAAEPFSLSRLLATDCLEGSLPWTPDTPIAGRAAAQAAYVARVGDAAFAPFSPSTVLAQSAAPLCRKWPPLPAPAPVPAAVPDVPLLVISGREDLRTPLEGAQAVAARYPRGSVVAVPGVGHSVLVNDGGGCARRAMVAFLHVRPVASCAGQAATLSRPASLPFIPETLAPGQAREAVALTLGGVLRDVAAGTAKRMPGLRGGTFRVGPDALTLSGVEWVRGVRLSGTVARRTRLRVSGRVHGRLHGRDGHLAGTLAGRPVRLVLDARMR